MPLNPSFTDPLSVSGGRQSQVRVATRIKAKADFVAAEAIVRRSPEYRAVREAALHDPLFNRSIFEVELPFKDVLGRDYAKRLKVFVV